MEFNVFNGMAFQVALGVKKITHLPLQETQEMWDQSLGWEDPPGGGHGNPLQYYCLENPMDGAALQTTALGLQRVGYN